MRNIVVDWLIEVADRLGISPSAFILSIYLFDIYLCKVKLTKNMLQLLGIVTMKIASMSRDVYIVHDNDLMIISAKAYSSTQFDELLKSVLTTVDYNLIIYTEYDYLIMLLDDHPIFNSSDRQTMINICKLISYYIEFRSFTPYDIASNIIEYMYIYNSHNTSYMEVTYNAIIQHIDDIIDNEYRYKIKSVINLML